ncbi:hypothetical protein M422DRAFT_247745 [Sphaerobolus stellatus SS14]|nr:hypothetical protein M422DRAFT_247745 [Sphaerobolus stellatus SS14]
MQPSASVDHALLLSTPPHPCPPLRNTNRQTKGRTKPSTPPKPSSPHSTRTSTGSQSRYNPASAFKFTINPRPSLVASPSYTYLTFTSNTQCHPYTSYDAPPPIPIHTQTYMSLLILVVLKSQFKCRHRRDSLAACAEHGYEDGWDGTRGGDSKGAEGNKG